MAELETQVVKIQLGDSKQATSYVYTLAETVDSSQAELYIVCELPLFNPAAADECQRIAEAIAGALRRTYKRGAAANTFEHALTVINEELGKLQNLGKTHWLGKLNAVIAVKSKTRLSVTSVGKVTALLYRDGNFAPIAEPSTPHHPLKTFENFAEGKLRLGDLLVLSTSQLFNHISIDRFKNLLKRNDLPDAAQEVISTLQDAMGPEVACGTILAQQVTAGSLDNEEEVDLGAYMAAPQVSSRKQSADWLDRLKDMSSTAATIGKNMGSSVKEKIKKAPKISEVVKGQSGALSVVQSQFKKAAKSVQPQTIKGYSKQKKIFMIAAAILLIAVIGNVAIAKYFSSKPKPAVVSQEQIDDFEKQINDANAAILYGDESQAERIISQLKERLNALGDVEESQKERINSIRSQVTALDNKLNNVSEAAVETVGTLGNADNLIVLPNYIATETNRTVVSYNRTSANVQDNNLRTSEPIMQAAYSTGNQAVIYNGSELLLWNFQSGVIGGAFSTDVPSQENIAGLTYYNNRVYLLDKANNRVMRYNASTTAFSAPTASISNVSEIANASDMAIDGNIYIAAGGTILKYNSGARVDFNLGASGLGEKTRIYANSDTTNLYVLDPEGKRILILSKTGSLIQTLTSSQFNSLKDFAVDETAKTIYVLNNNQLLKVSF